MFHPRAQRLQPAVLTGSHNSSSTFHSSLPSVTSLWSHFFLHPSFLPPHPHPILSLYRQICISTGENLRALMWVWRIRYWCSLFLLFPFVNWCLWILRTGSHTVRATSAHSLWLKLNVITFLQIKNQLVWAFQTNCSSKMTLQPGVSDTRTWVQK